MMDLSSCLLVGGAREGNGCQWCCRCSGGGSWFRLLRVGRSVSCSGGGCLPPSRELLNE